MYGCCCEPYEKMTREEKLDSLEKYRKALQDEARAVEKGIAELKKKKAK